MSEWQLDLVLGRLFLIIYNVTFIMTVEEMLCGCVLIEVVSARNLRSSYAIFQYFYSGGLFLFVYFFKTGFHIPRLALNSSV